RHTRWPRDWSSDVCSSDLSHRVSWAKWPYEPATALAPVAEEPAVVSRQAPRAFSFSTIPTFTFKTEMMPVFVLRVLALEPQCRRSEERRVGKGGGAVEGEG